MKTTNMAIVALALAALLVGAWCGEAEAQTRFGVRGGVYMDRDEPFLGAHLSSALQKQWQFNPNFEYVLVERGSLFSINADLRYVLPSRSTTAFWVGSGLGISHFSFRDFNQTDLGLNLITGVDFGRGPLTPFVQVKVMVLDETELVLGGGITF